MFTTWRCFFLAILLAAMAAVHGEEIPDQYLIVFEKSTPKETVAAAEEKVRGSGGRVLFRYSKALRGLAVKATPYAAASLRGLPGVVHFEPDQRVHRAAITQKPAPAGLDRVDQRVPALNKAYTYNETGLGVHVYVFDSGIFATHADFTGRVSGGFTAITDNYGTGDCTGHGTHVAGTIGGDKYGIAKKVSLHPVRVLDCAGSGTVSGVVAGIDWLLLYGRSPAVANMSVSGAVSETLDTAVANAIAAGITVVVAAGNTGRDACNASPARVPDAVTVGSINPDTVARSSFSSFGPCVDLYAPGEDILSAWKTSTTARLPQSGTSMAAPHAAGVAALYLQRHPTATPAMVWNAMNAASITTSTGELLLHWGALNDGKTDI